MMILLLAISGFIVPTSRATSPPVSKDAEHLLRGGKGGFGNDEATASLFAEDSVFWERLLSADASASMSLSDDPSVDLDPRLLDPCNQPLFQEVVPNALDPNFRFKPDGDSRYVVEVCKNLNHRSGLIDENGNKLITPIYGYGDISGEGCSATWPGKTFEVQSFNEVTIRWENNLPIEDYLLTSLDGVSVVDTSLHWAYSLPGYEQYSIPKNGVPIVPHVHGGHNDSPSDGNPEFFYSPGFEIKGPQWELEEYVYDNSQVATTSWYHDHALGITRLQVYAGMAGFFILRDELDTGKPENPFKLPAYPYEAAFAIQDRMFKKNGELFYPAFPGDPFYADFIDDEGADLPEDMFPNGGPTALAEFFGNVMVVNGIAWPKMEVEPRSYRLRLLNGCDSRFLVLQFFKVEAGEYDISTANADPIPFFVIADDHALAYETKTMATLMVEPGARYDIVISFAEYEGSRIIMKNIGPDEPFSGDEDDFHFPRDGSFCFTDRIMAFDVVKTFDDTVPDDFDPNIDFQTPRAPEPTKRRDVGLFEGFDEYGRLQPLQGVVGPATDVEGETIYWPNTLPYQRAGLAGFPIEGTVGWHSPTTEIMKLGTTEEWAIWNLSEDAHPIHIHLVFFEVVGRTEIVWDSATEDGERVLDQGAAIGDGTYLARQPLVQHNGELGQGFKVMNPTEGKELDTPWWYFESAPKDTVVALPGVVTHIKGTFDKPGRYVWHCHILAHEDHEMMRVMYISP